MPSFRCPRCQAPLARTQTPQGVAFLCAGCGGHATTLDHVRRSLPQPRFRAMWSTVKQSPAGTLPCPSCSAAMTVVRMGTLEVDTCVQCELLWLDPGEHEALSGPPPAAAPSQAEAAAAAGAGATFPSGIYRMTRAKKSNLIDAITGLQTMIIRDEAKEQIGSIQRVRSTSRVYNVTIGRRAFFVPGIRTNLHNTVTFRNRGELCRTIDATTAAHASIPLWFGSATWVYHRDKQLDWRYTSIVRMKQALYDGDRCIAEMSSATRNTVFLNTRIPLEDELIVFLFCLRWGINNPLGSGSLEDWYDAE